MFIRMATPQDAEFLRAIYAPYVEKTAITFEYEVPSVEEFRRRIERPLERYPYLVAEDEVTGAILGFVYVGQFRPRRACDWSVETSIYVSEDARGGGIGRSLPEAMRVALVEMGITNMCASIAVPRDADDPFLTEASVRFHKRMGYRMVGRFDCCGYKFGRWYDMVWMELVIAEHTTPAPELRSYKEVRKEA
jgi:phosphinothricin acetyltransferase